MSIKTLFLAVAVLVPAVSLAGIPTFYVATDGNNADDCATQGTACASIQFVYNNRVTVVPAEIRVLPGTYSECVELWGWTGDVPSTDKPVRLVAQDWLDSADNTTTILDGTGVCDGVGATPGNPVVSIGGTSGAEVEGFTITGGGGSGVFGQGSVAVTNNRITGNTSPAGGGVYLYTAVCYYSGNITASIENNTITGNSALDPFAEGLGDGGGIYVFALGFENGVDCAGGSPSVTIADNTVDQNTSENFNPDLINGGLFTTLGAGIFVLTGDALAELTPLPSSVVVTRNTITGNTQPVGTYGYGAGIWASTVGEGQETIRITDNTVGPGNIASSDGGGVSAWVQAAGDGVHDVAVRGNTITGNAADFNGGGLDLFMFNLNLNGGDTAILDAFNNDVAGNDAGADGGGLIVSFNSARSLDAADQASTFPGASNPADEITLSVRSNRVENNSSVEGGGGMILLPFADADPGSIPPLCDVMGPSTANIDLVGNFVAGNTASATTLDIIGGGILALPAARGEAAATITIDRTTVGDNQVGAAAFVGGVEVSVASADGTTTVPDCLWLETDGAEGFIGEAVLSVQDSVISLNQRVGLGGPPLDAFSNLTLDVTGNYVYGNQDGDYETTLFFDPNPPEDNPTDDPLLDPQTLIPDVCSPVYTTGAGFLTSPDVNADGGVDGVDIVKLAVGSSSMENELPTLPDARYDSVTDLDSDGIIDGDDLTVMFAGFGDVCVP